MSHKDEAVAKASCYLVLRSPRKGQVVVERVTKGLPHSVRGNEIVIQLSLSIPERAFRPPFFEANVEVPENYVGRIIVRAEDPAPAAPPVLGEGADQ